MSIFEEKTCEFCDRRSIPNGFCDWFRTEVSKKAIACKYYQRNHTNRSTMAELAYLEFINSSKNLDKNVREKLVAIIEESAKNGDISVTTHVPTSQLGFAVAFLRNEGCEVDYRKTLTHQEKTEISINWDFSGGN